MWNLARVWRMKTTSSDLLIYVKDLMKLAEDVRWQRKQHEQQLTQDLQKFLQKKAKAQTSRKFSRSK